MRISDWSSDVCSSDLSIKGRYQEVLDITRTALQRDWKPGKKVPVVEAMQHIVVEQLGMVLTGQTPREYVRDIRTTILYILNVLVTRQRPKFLIKKPTYKLAKAHLLELGHKEDTQNTSEKRPRRQTK